MTATDALARRPLIGAVAGLLLVSACANATESMTTPNSPTTDTTDVVIAGAPELTPPAPASTRSDETGASTAPSTTPTPSTSAAPAVADQPITTTPASTTTLPPTTNPPVTVPPTDPAPIDAVDVAGRTVFGVSVFDAVDVEAVTGDVSARLGSPTTDSGWQSTVGASCAGSTDSRVLWWGDFRMTFERYRGDGAVRDELSAWTVGDPTLFGFVPIGEVPAPSGSDIVTLEGIGLGSTLVDVRAAWANVNDGGDNRIVVVDRGGSLTIQFDNDDRVVGFGDGPFDCPVDEMR